MKVIVQNIFQRFQMQLVFLYVRMRKNQDEKTRRERPHQYEN